VAYDTTKPIHHGEGLIVEADFHSEVATAPSIGNVYNTKYPAYLSETMEIEGYVRDVDFIDLANVGFQNVSIPQGETITVEYFSKSSPTLVELGPLAHLVPDVQAPPTVDGSSEAPPVVQPSGRGGNSGTVRYVNLLKMGV
jgi:hypothetical protein